MVNAAGAIGQNDPVHRFHPDIAERHCSVPVKAARDRSAVNKDGNLFPERQAVACFPAVRAVWVRPGKTRNGIQKYVFVKTQVHSSSRFPSHGEPRGEFPFNDSKQGRAHSCDVGLVRVPQPEAHEAPCACRAGEVDDRADIAVNRSFAGGRKAVQGKRHLPHCWFFQERRTGVSDKRTVGSKIHEFTPPVRYVEKLRERRMEKRLSQHMKIEMRGARPQLCQDAFKEARVHEFHAPGRARAKRAREIARVGDLDVGSLERLHAMDPGECVYRFACETNCSIVQ